MEKGRYPNKLKLFRHSKGYSRKKVARMVGLADPSQLSKWERGIVIPNLLQVLLLARIYQTHPHELFDELWKQVGNQYNLLAQHPEPSINNQSFPV
jgi:transcriptional regulator with XRE-family HTH domain